MPWLKLPRETEELLRWRRADCGSETLGAVDVDDAVEATEAEWARRAVSSRVRRFTCGREKVSFGYLR